MKNQAALDAIQAQLNPAYLDRLPRPHDLLASDIASHIADAARDLADDLADDLASGNRWRVADLTAADAQDATLLASRAYDAAWLELCYMPLATLAVVCACMDDRYHGDQFAARECAVDAVRALRDVFAARPHLRKDYILASDHADDCVRSAVRAAVNIVLATTEGGAA